MKLVDCGVNEKGFRVADKLPEFDLELYLPYRFTVVAARLSDDLAKKYKKRYGISIPEWRVLLNVGYTKNLSVRDIEKRVNLEKSKVSRTAAKLEAKGHLIKQVDSDDRRLVKLTLTPQGVRLLGELIPIAQAYQTELHAILGDQIGLVNQTLDLLSKDDQ